MSEPTGRQNEGTSVGAPADAPPIDRVLAPFRDFARQEAAGGILLMVAALVALVWANSPAADGYTSFWHLELRVGVGGLAIAKTLHEWVNDGLMAIFFFVVGLEIKRELLVGELASPSRALLPIGAAIGGAVVPAAIFLVVAGGSAEAVRGWGIPMATDIAFSLGVLALLGPRIPTSLRVFLAALAIADDVIAVAVIAVFYSGELSVPALAAAVAILVGLAIAGRAGVRRPLVFGALGIALWLAVLESGVHATVAGVLLAATIPSRTRIDRQAFVGSARRLLGGLTGRDGVVDGPVDAEEHAALWDLEDLTERAQSPMLRMEHALHPWVALLIVPIFALANSGVVLGGDAVATVTDPVVLAVFLGLVVGKQVGVSAAARLIVGLGLASLPPGLSWRQIHGVAWLAGIGFTMSLFVADLAFGDSATLALAKIGILAASIVSGTVGYLVLRGADDARGPR